MPQVRGRPKGALRDSGRQFTSKPHAGRIENGNILYRERLQSGYYAQS